MNPDTQAQANAVAQGNATGLGRLVRIAADGLSSGAGLEAFDKALDTVHKWAERLGTIAGIGYAVGDSVSDGGIVGDIKETFDRAAQSSGRKRRSRNRRSRRRGGKGSGPGRSRPSAHRR